MGHESDNDASHHRDEWHDPWRERGTGRLRQRKTEAVVIEEIGGEGNGPQQKDGECRAAHPDRKSYAGEKPDTNIQESRRSVPNQELVLQR